MTLPTHEFIRRFLIHVLPKGLHRIRHYGLFANGKNRAANIARARQLFAVPLSAAQPEGLHRCLKLADKTLGEPERLIRVKPERRAGSQARPNRLRKDSAKFVVKLAQQFNLEGKWGFEWAASCSKPWLDHFGGGAVTIDLATGVVEFFNTFTWLEDHTKSNSRVREGTASSLAAFL